MPKKTFTAGEVLTAADVNSFLMDQSVMTFATSAARGSAIGTATEGMVSYLNDTNSLEVFDGSAWNTFNPQSGNAIINGAFDFWQRGTSFTGNQYIADRWVSIPSGTGTTTFSRVDVSTDSSVVGQYALQIAKSSGATSGDYFLQRIEDVKSVTGQLTYSLYAKANAATDITVYARQYFGTGGSPSAVVDVLFGTISVPSGSTFQRFSLSATLSNLTGKTIGTNGDDYVEFFAIVSNSANATLTVTNVQVENGSVATPFRRNANSLQGELAACQRYYWRQEVGPGFEIARGTGSAISTTVGNIVIQNPTAMRTNAISVGHSNVFASDGVSVFSSNLSSVALIAVDPLINTIALTYSTPTLTEFRPIYLQGNASAGFIDINAEL